MPARVFTHCLIFHSSFPWNKDCSANKLDNFKYVVALDKRRFMISSINCKYKYQINYCIGRNFGTWRNTGTLEVLCYFLFHHFLWKPPHFSFIYDRLSAITINADVLMFLSFNKVLFFSRSQLFCVLWNFTEAAISSICRKLLSLQWLKKAFET